MAAIANMPSVVPIEHGDQYETLLHILFNYSTHRWLSKKHLNIDGHVRKMSGSITNPELLRFC
jgi:hypothetical protein